MVDFGLFIGFLFFVAWWLRGSYWPILPMWVCFAFLYLTIYHNPDANPRIPWVQSDAICLVLLMWLAAAPYCLWRLAYEYSDKQRARIILRRSSGG